MLYAALIFKQFTKSKLPLQNNVPSSGYVLCILCTSFENAVCHADCIFVCRWQHSATKKRLCIYGTFIMSWLIIPTKD